MENNGIMPALQSYHEYRAGKQLLHACLMTRLHVQPFPLLFRVYHAVNAKQLAFLRHHDLQFLCGDYS